jgi:hypothetical protein
MRGSQQLAAVDYASGFFEGVDEAIENFASQKKTWDSMLISSDWSALEARVFRFSEVPSVMFSGSFSYEVDFLGRRVQPNLPGIPLHSASLCVFADGAGGGAAILAWLRGNRASEMFAQSLDSIADERIPSALLRLGFCFVENLAFSIPWWDDLGNADKGLVLEWLDSGLEDDHQRPANALRDRQERLVSWPLTGRFAI